MEEELLAQPQVIKLLDSLREQYTRYQELCRQRNKRTQLDEIHTKVMQVSPVTSSILAGLYTLTHKAIFRNMDYQRVSQCVKSIACINSLFPVMFF